MREECREAQGNRCREDQIRAKQQQGQSTEASNGPGGSEREKLRGEERRRRKTVIARTQTPSTCGSGSAQRGRR